MPLPHAAGNAMSTPPTILVVDDEEGTRETVSAILRSRGFAVATADGGFEALRLAVELRPAAIVLDVVMPDLDGWAVLQRLKADPKLAAIPVIMNTALTEPSQGYVLGACDYLTKPVDRRELVRVVQHQIRLQQRGPIVLVEPDPGTLELTVAALQEQGWPVAEASTAREALDRVSAARPCLIMIDPHLPEGDGFALLEELHLAPAWQAIPVMALVGQPMSPEQERLLNRCADRILHKGTYSLDELFVQIAALTPPLTLPGA